MRQATLLDTGPLVAALNARDVHHAWASARWAELEAPMLTCEAVVAEACHLLRRTAGGSAAVVELVQRGVIAPSFSLEEEATSVVRLMKRFADVPMSLADACLVRMAELDPGSRVLTIDSGFHVYRTQGRRVVPTIMPPLE